MSLDLVNVSYIYDSKTSYEKTALQDVSLSIPEGSFVGIAGLSGSGKTTLVRLIKGLIKPSSGSIKGVESSKVGLVFQYPEFQLFEATVIKDVMFGPLNIGLGEEEARRQACQALSVMGLDEAFYERDPLCLSGGEKRRVAIAGILAMDPEVLILDEPTAGLDAQMHDQLFEVLQRLNAQGKTIILVSHNMDDVASYCKQVVALKEGKVVAFGAPSEVFYHSALQGFEPTVVKIAKNLGLEGVCTLDKLVNCIAN